ncbi:hypothetical protein VTK73DRAFT_2507 [Phialemonium thermophilum]|uniref:FAD-binding domain-containing protein n=1 Tax=Phialemonium thermophilum TaxID=223376 RepID=A0ABR3X4C4_9PEZI
MAVQHPFPMPPPPAPPSLHVAIIGAGITGLSLALGLQARDVHFTIYERADGLHEVGAGLGLSPNAERALALLHPGAGPAFRRVAMPNGEDYFQWVDGYCSDKVVCRLYLGEEAVSLAQQKDGRQKLGFRDGSSAVADVDKSCFRALSPMDRARAALGEYRTSTRFMYNGPGAHVITYPVSDGALLNILAVVTEDNTSHTSGTHDAVTVDSAHPATMTEQLSAPSAPKTTGTSVAARFADWHPRVRAAVELLASSDDNNKEGRDGTAKLDRRRWDIYDMYEHPAPQYWSGTVCLAGDAAHATGPHLGAGAGFGIEDALALSALFEVVDGIVETRVNNGRSGKNGTAEKPSTQVARVVRAALSAYNDVRYERAQWLIGATREACELIQSRDRDWATDVEDYEREISWRFHKIWDYDVNGMVQEALDRFEARRMAWESLAS